MLLYSEFVTSRIEFYVDKKGACPAEEFIKSLDIKDRAKIIWLIKKLGLTGTSLPFPFSSQVGGKMQELRIRSENSTFSILYYHDPRDAFVILRGLKRRSNQLPQLELERAMEHLNQDLKAKRNEVRLDESL